MGIYYYNSLKDKKVKIKDLQKKGYQIFYREFVDEQGNSTTGSKGQLIFGTKEQQEKSIEPCFTKPAQYFYLELESIKTLTDIYPLMYDQYQDYLFSKFPERLGFNIKNYSPEQLLSLYHFKQSLALKNLPREQRSLVKQDDGDKALLALSKNKKFLSNSQNFIREMSLIYLVTLFYGYLTTILYEIFRHNPDLIKLIPKAHPLRRINSIDKEEQFKLELYEFVDKEFSVYGIKKTSENLKKYFDFDFEGKNFEKLEECLERRNMLVHHEGKPNKRYRKKFPEFSNLTKLVVSQKYLLERIKIIEGYQVRINNFFWSKYGKPIYLKQMT